MSAGVFGRLLRASLGRLGGSWVAAPERTWAAPGTSWGPLGGAFLKLLGGSWAPLGGSWNVLGPLWAGFGSVLGTSGQLGRSGRLLGHCIKHRKNSVFYMFLGLRVPPGGLPRTCWPPLGVSWALQGLLDRPRRPGRVSPGRRNLPGPAQTTSGQVKKSSKSSDID